MAITVINDPYRNQSASLGNALGKGLGQGVQLLAQHKLEEILNRSKQEKIQNALRSLNLNPEYSSLDPSILREIVKAKIQGPNIAQVLSSYLTGKPVQGGLLENPKELSGNSTNVQQAMNSLPPSEDNALQNIARQAGQLGIRGLEGLAQGPIDLATLPFNIAHLVSGGKMAVPETVQKLQKLPRNITKTLTGEALEPKSDTEESLGNFVSDITSLLSPAGLLGAAGKVFKGAQWLNKAAQFLKISPKAAATLSGVGNAAQWLTKKLGGSEKTQTGAKMGSMLLVPLLGPRFASREVANIAQQAEHVIQQSDVVKSPGLFKILGDFYNRIEKMAPSNIKESLLNALQPLPGNQFPVRNLWDLKQVVNQVAQDSQSSRSLKNILPSLTQELDKALLSSNNKQFAQLFSHYNDLSNAVKETSVIQNFLYKHLIRRTQNPIVASFLGITGYKKPQLIPALGVAFGIGEVERVVKMALKSPAFRNTYSNLLNAALRGNVKASNEYAQKLESLFNKENINT